MCIYNKYANPDIHSNFVVMAKTVLQFEASLVYVRRKTIMDDDEK